jgi:hypothetical protein
MVALYFINYNMSRGKEKDGKLEDWMISKDCEKWELKGTGN